MKLSIFIAHFPCLVKNSIISQNFDICQKFIFLREITTVGPKFNYCINLIKIYFFDQHFDFYLFSTLIRCRNKTIEKCASVENNRLYDYVVKSRYRKIFPPIQSKIINNKFGTLSNVDAQKIVGERNVFKVRPKKVFKVDF